MAVITTTTAEQLAKGVYSGRLWGLEVNSRYNQSFTASLIVSLLYVCLDNWTIAKSEEIMPWLRWKSGLLTNLLKSNVATPFHSNTNVSSAFK